MSINLYSKASVDTLLAAKLSDAPSDGSTYGRKDGAWEVVSGGGGSYLALAGGAMDNDAVITIANATTDIRYGSDFIGLNLTGSYGSIGSTFDYNGINIFSGTDSVNIQPTQLLLQSATTATTIIPGSITMGDGTIDSQMAPEYFGVELSSDHSQYSELQYSGVTSANSSGFSQLNPSGVRFPDGTTQTTAATAGVNLGDAFSVANAMTVAFSGSYPYPGQWQIDFRPVNSYIAAAVSIYVENADGSISQDAKGSVSTSSNWSYTTGYDTFPADTYLYLKVNGIKATMPINYI